MSSPLYKRCPVCGRQVRFHEDDAPVFAFHFCLADGKTISEAVAAASWAREVSDASVLL